MIWSSLRLRLSIAAALSILAALILSGIFLTLIFERHVTRRVDAELTAYIKQLTASLDIGADREPTLIAPLADPRFDRPFSGLYWQIEDDSGVVLGSRSLWIDTLPLPPFDLKTRETLRLEAQGPDEEPMIVQARTVFVETSEGDRAFRLAVAVDKSEITAARNAFRDDLVVALTLLAVALLGASILQISFGLRPLGQIRQRVNAVRTGAESKLEGNFPHEVQLLVTEVNALLSANDQAVQRARDSAADLAHGLKTPLAVLQAESRTLRNNQAAASAREIEAQVEQMHARVERHLAQVRMRGSGSGLRSTPLRSSVEKIVRAMKTMPGEESLEWRIDIPDDLSVPVDAEDLLEVLGNIIDNARKWARHEIAIVAHVDAKDVEIVIADDGPGVPEELQAHVMQRGKRLDEFKTGAGLGLSIAERILQGYGGTLSLGSGSGGGAKVIIAIPTRP